MYISKSELVDVINFQIELEREILEKSNDLPTFITREQRLSNIDKLELIVTNIENSKKTPIGEIISILDREIDRCERVMKNSINDGYNPSYYKHERLQFTIKELNRIKLRKEYADII